MIGIIGIIKQPNRFNMMHFRRVVYIAFVYAARLASIIIAVFCITAVAYPIFAIVRFITTEPAIAIFTCFIFGLPFAHTFGITEMMFPFVYFGFFTVYLFAAKVTIHKRLPPLKQSEFAFHRACYRVFATLHSVRSNIYHFFAYRTFGSRIIAAISIFAIARTKPLARFISGNNRFLAIYRCTAIKARKMFSCFHMVLPPVYNYTTEQRVITCEHIQRLSDMGLQPERIE